MEINIILISSGLVAHRDVRAIHKDFVNNLEKTFTIHYYTEETINELDVDNRATFVWIASGGTERKFIEMYSKMSHPIYLINDGISNSLAASLEISSWLNRQEKECTIIHGISEKSIQEMQAVSIKFETKKKLQGKRIGVVGEPSDWLIASDVDHQLAQTKWGVEFVPVDLNRVFDYYSNISEEQVEEDACRFESEAIKQIEGDHSEIVKAMRLYYALRNLCNEHNLDAMTLRCFGLIEGTKTTGCLALALLNKDGIIAGCEGDKQTVLSLLIAKAATGKTGFMANPSLIMKDKNEMVLSHCMIDPSLTQKYVIRSHYETLSGIALQGILPTGAITIFKIGGKQLERNFISKGELIENTDYPNFCRTQAHFKLEESVSYFLEEPIGNHHVILWGDQSEKLKALFA